MFLPDWFYGVLTLSSCVLVQFYVVLALLRSWQKEANIFHGLWQKEANILLLGPDNARKTTLLRLLKNERLVQDQPTQYLLNAEEFRIGEIKLKAFDWGGTRISLRVWQDYHVRVDAVVYLLDHLNTWRRFDELRLELAMITQLAMIISDVEMADVPFLVLVDRPDRAFVNLSSPVRWLLCRYISERENEAPPRFGSAKVFECDIEGKMGYRDGFKWLSQYIR